jgi:7-cyano-7-deazaguanine synthase
MTGMTAAPPALDLPSSLAVLASGGLDSAILLAECLQSAADVHPLYVRFGLAWESAELRCLRRFVEAVATPALRPLEVLDLPVGDVYGRHWSLTGEGVPGAGTPDEAVFLPGRNVLLLAKAMLWCHLRGVAAVALAPLEGNPFPDATPGFFAAYEAVFNRAVGGRVRVLRPYRELHKTDVLRRGRGLPLEWTFSCIRPAAGPWGERHCGACNKCAERRQGFGAAGLTDPTAYAGGDHV